MKKITPIIIFALFASGCQHVEEYVEDLASDKVVFESSVVVPKLSDNFKELWDTEVTQKEVSGTALYKTFNFFEKNSKDSLEKSVILKYQEPLSDEEVGWINDATEVFLSGFSSHITRDSYLFVGYSVDWLALEADKLSLDLPEGQSGGQLKPFEEWAKEYFPDNRQVGWTIDEVAYIGMNPSRKYGEYRFPILVAHELYHSMHLSINGEELVGGVHETPLWFGEGAAEFFSTAVISWGLDRDYFAPVPRAGSYDLPIKAEDVQPLDFYEDPSAPWQAYAMGHIAIEYLVASKGPESILEVYELLEEGMLFEEAFFSVYGITQESFYEIYDEEIIYLFVEP